MSTRKHQLSDLRDLKFGRLTVIERIAPTKDAIGAWLCKCDCGEETTAQTSALRSSRKLSCGCLRKETAANTARTRKQREKRDWTGRETKYCPDCREEHPVSEFGKNSRSYDKLTAYCKFHHYERGSKSRADQPGGAKAYKLRYKYGISIEQYEHMLEGQDHKCAICLQYPKSNLKNPWHVDHDHSSGKVRGILCHSCNTALGNFNDDPDVMGRALKYIGRGRKG